MTIDIADTKTPGVFELREKRKWGWFTYYKTIMKVAADSAQDVLDAMTSVPGTVVLNPETGELIKENPYAEEVK